MCMPTNATSRQANRKISSGVIALRVRVCTRAQRTRTYIFVGLTSVPAEGAIRVVYGAANAQAAFRRMDREDGLRDVKARRKRRR
jgi:hypothetical protein